MATKNLVGVSVTLTSLDEAFTKVLEPRTSVPAARLEAIRRLSQVGVPVGVMVAPVIPGLTDREIPSILHQASEAGARRADYVLLRLPQTVKPIFLDWLERNAPQRANRVRSHLCEAPHYPA